MNYKHFIGIDVSKMWLDFTIMLGNQVLNHQQIENSQKAIRDYFKVLSKDKDFKLSETLVCMEHTGIYNNNLLEYFTKVRANICLESGLQIKQSSGLKRGKNDKVDSIRIAMYAYKNHSEIKLWQPRREVIYTLKQLTTLRNRTVNVIKQMKTPIKESSAFLKKKEQKKIFSLNRGSLLALENDLKKINKEIATVISLDPELNRLFNLITSVTGIGAITATEVIITTNEFKTIDCPKKYACYSGIAPFNINLDLV